MVSSGFLITPERSVMRLLLRKCLLIIMILEATGAGELDAQLQHPGKPFGFESSLKAAEVMYLLPPMDPLELEADRLMNRQEGAKTIHFAVERTVDLSPATQGSWMQQGKMRVWRVHVVSPEAYSLGLVFNGYQLEEGVKVFVYDPGMRHIKGAFTAGNNKPSRILPVGHIPGQEMIVEMQVPLGLIDYGVLHLESVSHAFLPLFTEELKRDIRFGRSQDCEIDINCEEGASWQLHKRSVVRIFTTREYCTGVMVNTTAYDGIPYLLTSEHCINRTYYADRSVFVFNYESPSCFGGDGSTDLSISGCDTISVGDSIDFSLVRLSLPPPDSFDVYFAGWDLNEDQFSRTVTIHHPEGDIKKISIDEDPPSIVEEPGDIPPGELRDYYYFSYWWIKQWDVGSTEGGSSGSPLFNSAGRMIGILTGGYASCGDSIGYDAEEDRVIYSMALNRNDYYTRMDVAWDYNGDTGPVLKPWLDPLDSGAVAIGGYYPAYITPPGSDPGARFRIFPNPVRRSLYIVPLSAGQHRISYRVLDLSGRLHMTGEFVDAEQISLDIRMLSPGSYVIALEAGGEIEYKRFIVPE